jgi:hypothetical protein
MMCEWDVVFLMGLVLEVAMGQETVAVVAVVDGV